VNGYIFKSGDIEDLAEIIVNCAENMNDLGRIKENARETALKRFTIERMIAEIKEAYNGIV
jgi:glycosyltransferase involved in cell wall biosynthesis